MMGTIYTRPSQPQRPNLLNQADIGTPTMPQTSDIRGRMLSIRNSETLELPTTDQRPKSRDQRPKSRDKPRARMISKCTPSADYFSNLERSRKSAILKTENA